MSAEPVAVARVQRMGSYQGVPALGCLLSIEAEKRLKVNDPLYDRATLDAAVAAARAEERERCETLARYALDAATEGNWAYAAVLLQRIKGEPSGSDAAAIRDLKPE